MQPCVCKLIKITPCSRATKLVNFQIISTLSNESWNKIFRLCLKLLLPTILTSSLPFYPYQKDERAFPGYLLTRRSFSPSDIKRLSLPPRCFLFTCTLILSFLTLSLLRLQKANLNTFCCVTYGTGQCPPDSRFITQRRKYKFVGLRVKLP
jgi:hypothetical protein